MVVRSTYGLLYNKFSCGREVHTQKGGKRFRWIYRDFQGKQFDLMKKIQGLPYSLFTKGFSATRPKVLLLISYFAPDTAMLQFSKELVECEGIFVIEKLPQGGFREFSEKLVRLRFQGMKADVQINAELFKKFEIIDSSSFNLVTTGEEIRRGSSGFRKVAVFPGTDDSLMHKKGLTLRPALSALGHRSCQV